MRRAIEVGHMVRCRLAKATVGRVLSVEPSGLLTVEILYGDGAGCCVGVRAEHWTSLGPPKR